MPKSLLRRTGSTTSWKTPEPTDVLSYAYLWAREAADGQDEGTKDRPVVVVLATLNQSNGLEVIVAPVTTSPPAGNQSWVEIPPQVKTNLGLDTRRSWIVDDEVNRFIWPGPDVRVASKQGETSPYYGQIPGNLLRALRERLSKHSKTNRIKSVKRSD